MNRGFFSNFWDSYFSSYGEFVEFSLRFTAAVSAVAVGQHIILKYVTQVVFHCSGVRGACGSECGSAHYTKIGDAGVHHRGLWTSLALLKWVAAHVER